ncbi:mandelate racemase/muconate lactonizing enzyme family protein [Neobacillus drentensis]|uniref:mandelate racemase/muconate lactonizing enzyme family protein n=1 Tax=Neobacillus drentensis TaxID=220684 RepID=UPI002FFD9DA3
MKITNVRAFPLGVKLDQPLRWGAMEVNVKGGIIVQVSTDEGLYGIGEAGFSAEYFSTVGPIINERLAPLLIGEDPTQIAMLWERMFSATHMWGRRGIETYALSGVDIALWDLFGKITNQPIYKLLGAAKTKVRAYFAPSLKGPEEIVPECVKAVEDGYTALKLRVGLGLETDEAIVSGVRKAVGDKVDLMVDANMAYDRRTALRMARVFEELGVVWLEEPIRSRSLSQYIHEHRWLSERVNMQLSGGESMLSRYEYIDLLEPRVFDVLQPDCVSVGGISEAKRVADMASAWNITCVPHIACSSGMGVGLAAGLHLILSCPNAPLIEYDAYGGPGWEGMLKEPILLKDGYVSAPEGPGLGIELAADAEERYRLYELAR